MIISNIFPNKTFYQGDTWAFSVFLQNYDASLYTLNYQFAKINIIPFTISSTINPGNDFVFNVSSTLTADYAPGIYTVSAKLTDSSNNKTTIGVTELEIKPDLSVIENGDPRSMNRKALDDIEDALALGAGSDVQEYTIAGSTYKKNRDGLLKLRAYYLVKVRKEMGISAIGVINYSL